MMRDISQSKTKEHVETRNSCKDVFFFCNYTISIYFRAFPQKHFDFDSQYSIVLAGSVTTNYDAQSLRMALEALS